MSGGASTAAGTGWPARIIHVNEDGWVLINHGSAQGVAVGLRLLVVTQGTRQLRDLYRGEGTTGQASVGTGGADADGGPVVLRFRRTFELLEVIYAERACAIAIAARVPVERRPTVYRGADGELMVWVPLPATYAYPQTTTNTDDEEDTTDDADETESAQPGDLIPPSADPEGSVDQEDELWEQALPLNGLHVGDWVMPALPAAPQVTSARTSTPGTAQTGATPTATHTGDDQPYEWMKI